MNFAERQVAIPTKVNVVHGHFPEVGAQRFVIAQFFFAPEPPLLHGRAMEFALIPGVARALASGLIQGSIFVDEINLRQQLSDVHAMAENLARMAESGNADLGDLRAVIAAIRERAELPPAAGAADERRQEGPPDSDSAGTDEREAT